jgi:hypothetical protein
MRDRRGSPLKVDQRMVHRIKELRSQKMTQGEISAEVGISQGTVSLILRANGMGGKFAKVREKLY